jgi:DNA processing protein
MTDREEERAARIVLSYLAEPGNLALHTMMHADGAVAALQRLLSGDIPDESLRTTATSAIATSDPRRRADAALRHAQRLGARVVVPGDDEWPTRIDDLGVPNLGGQLDPGLLPPLCLWVRGPASLRESVQRSVAVVGARAATAYGIRVCTDLAYGLTERGWSIVAGGAYGIDAAAHAAALARDSCTVAVLECGVDRLYPSGNAALLGRIAGTGLLVSEYPPGAEPLRHRFLARNRLVAAVTAGSVLIEAAVRSGSLHMMRRVLDLHRPAMVVPGPVTSVMSAGCHELLRTPAEATLVTGAVHVLEVLDRAETAAATPPPDGPHALDE